MVLGSFDFVVVRGCEVFFETNSKKGPLKMDGWKMTISFWGLVLLASGSCNPLKGDFKPF